MDATANTDTCEELTRVFVSYAREDKRWLDRDDRHNLIPFLMESMKRQKVVFWYDKELRPGDEFKSNIEAEIDRSQIALLIVSQHFLNSEFIEKQEMPRIANRARHGQMIIVPVLAEPCDWHDFPILADRQMVPGPMPLIDYTESEPAWVKVRAEILDGLKTQIKRIREKQEASRAKRAPVGSAPRPGDLPQRKSVEPTPTRTVAQPEPVVLFDPRAVWIATLCGKPIAGSILLAINYSRLGKAAAVWMAIAVGVLLSAAISFATFMLHFETWAGMILAVDFGIAFGMSFAAKQLQGNEVKENLRRGSHRGSYWASFGIGLLGLVAVLGSIGLVKALTETSVTIGARDKVVYSGAATKEEAEALGNALKPDDAQRPPHLEVLPRPAPAVKEGAWIFGVVQDASGAPIPNADVTLTNESDNTSSNVVASDAGDYHFEDLGTGSYTLKVQASGWANFRSNSIEVTAGKTIKANVTLKVGSSE